MRPPLILALGALLAFVAVAGAAQAQSSSEGFKRCGDPELSLVFMNPDLRVQDDGFIHAGGTFFIQFQARGERAFDIETFKFSFGPYVRDVDQCNQVEHVTGIYIKNYRADNEARDGFHIPIDTCLVPNGEYSAAVSAYDKDEKEIARYYAKAKVKNGDDDTVVSAQKSSADRCTLPETTAPWPLILPGDGERLDGGQGLYIEVAEEIAEIKALINSREIELTKTEAPFRDNDLIPDLGYHPIIRDMDGISDGQVNARQYGPAYVWTGDIKHNDVIRVRIVDLWGNVADKVVHIGDPTIGGRVTAVAPDFELVIPETRKTAAADGTARYNVTYITKGSEGLHADLYIEGPDGASLPPGIGYRLNPDHVMMGGYDELRGQIVLFATRDVTPGTFRLTFVADYLKGDVREQKRVVLTFQVDSVPDESLEEREGRAGTDEDIEQQNVRSGDAVKAETEEIEEIPETQKRGLPGPGPAILAGLAGLAALMRRRRG